MPGNHCIGAVIGTPTAPSDGRGVCGINGAPPASSRRRSSRLTTCDTTSPNEV